METCKTCRFYEADYEYHHLPGEHYPAYMDRGENDKLAYVGRCRIRAPEARHFFPVVDGRAWCGEWEAKPCYAAYNTQRQFS